MLYSAVYLGLLLTMSAQERKLKIFWMEAGYAEVYTLQISSPFNVNDLRDCIHEQKYVAESVPQDKLILWNVSPTSIASEP